MAYRPQVREGARAPLFDRLVGDGPGERDEPAPPHTLDRDGLEQSIARELADLLNTRSSLAWSELESRPLTTLEYGLPDYAGRLTRDPASWKRISSTVESTIVAFEPRLSDVSIEVVPDDDGIWALLVLVRASMRLGSVVEPVNLTVPVGAVGGGGRS